MRQTAIIFLCISFLFTNSAYGHSFDSQIKNDDTLPATAGRAQNKSDHRGMEARGPFEIESAPIQRAKFSVSEYLKVCPGNLAGETKSLFSNDNAPLVLIGSGLTLMALSLDVQTRNETQDDHPFGSIRAVGNTLGNTYTEIAAGGAMLLAGQLSENRRLFDTGIVTLEALLIDGAATQTLKYAVGRERPDGSGDKRSFPSGHTSVTAALASSVSEMYDWDPKVAIPLFATVAIVGAARMESNMHYLSDVLGGAALGTLIGASVAKYHKKKTNGYKVHIAPICDKEQKGLILSFQP